MSFEERDGVDRIATERSRQVLVEGWSREHDAGHVGGGLVFAAIRYAAATRPGAPDLQSLAWSYWQWDEEWWKPSDDPIRNLEKAGALIAAEIDRLLADPVEDTQ